MFIRTDYDELRWKIQMRRLSGKIGRAWETIAAFNSETVAKRYAEDCQLAAERHRSPYEYRVEEEPAYVAAREIAEMGL